MVANYFIRGLIIAIIFGVPAGVIGALTIERTLSGGFIHGLCTGFGSSVADVLYAAVGAFGIAIIADFLTKYQIPISVAGGVVIIFLGISTFRRKVKEGSPKAQVMNSWKCFATAFMVAILNPSTLLSFLLAFSTFGIADNLAIGEGVLLCTGVLFGTCVWWLILAGGVTIFKKHITTGIYNVLNKCLGVFLIVFGVVIILRNFWH